MPFDKCPPGPWRLQSCARPDLVSFYPEKVMSTIDDEKLELVSGQNLLARGPDGDLGVDEIGGGVQLVEDAVQTEV